MRNLTTKVVLLFLFSTVFNYSCFAQSNLEETMYASGRINVVIAVAMVILLAIFALLFVIERKLNKVEKQLENKA